MIWHVDKMGWMRWDGVGQYGMGWDGILLGWGGMDTWYYGIGWDGIAWDGM